MAKVQKIKGSIYMRNVQNNELGLVKYRKDRKDQVVLFVNSGLDKQFTNGTPVSGVLIKQYHKGMVRDVLVNITKESGKRKVNRKLAMMKSGGKKKNGTVTEIDMDESRIIITSDAGFPFVAYGTAFFPVGTAVDFTDSGNIDPATGLMIATNVEVEPS